MIGIYFIDFLPKTDKEEEIETTEKWVVFVENEFSKSIIKNLQEQGKLCYAVHQGNTYEQNGNTFTIGVTEKPTLNIRGSSHSLNLNCPSTLL